MPDAAPPKRARMGQIMVLVGLFAAILLLVAGVQGYGDLDPEGQSEGAGLRNHILLSLVAVLVLLLARGWLLFYQLGMVRLLRLEAARLAPEAPARAAAVALGRRFHRLVLPCQGVTLGAALALFFLGASAEAGWVAAWIHEALFYAVLAVHLVTLGLEWRLGEATEDAVQAARERALGETGAP